MSANNEVVIKKFTGEFPNDSKAVYFVYTRDVESGEEMDKWGVDRFMGNPGHLFDGFFDLQEALEHAQRKVIREEVEYGIRFKEENIRKNELDDEITYQSIGFILGKASQTVPEYSTMPTPIKIKRVKPSEWMTERREVFRYEQSYAAKRGSELPIQDHLQEVYDYLDELQRLNPKLKWPK